MATRTETPTLEQIHAEVPTRNAAAVGEELAQSIHSGEAYSAFESCRVAHAAVVDSGLKASDVADATTKAIRLITRDPTRSISRPAISQRVNAWADLLAAGIEPTPDTVAAAYSLATTGGSTPYREKLVAKVRKLASARRADAFIKGVGDAKKAIKAARKAAQSETAATTSADGKAETPAENPAVTVMQDTADEVVATLNAWAAREWTAAERKQIREGMRALARAIG